MALAVGLGEASRLALEECSALLLHLLSLKLRLVTALCEGFASPAEVCNSLIIAHICMKVSV